MTKKQMLINYVPGEECRIAVVEDGRLEEFHSERAGAVSYVGNVYVGRVTNVEPSIQAAFIDFGRDASGFLHVTDVHPMYFPPGEREATETIGRKTPRRERPPIQQCLKRGQQLVVQVIKEGINTKGPTLTSYTSIPGRYLVMLPDMDRVGVSRKVEDDDLRREMRKVLDTLDLPDGFGFILRTAGMGKGKTELKRDLAYLHRLWKDLEKKRATGSKPRLLYAESDLMMRALRDFWTSEINEIIIDDESALERAGRFMRIVSPRSSTRLLRYDHPTPMLHAFGIEQQIALTHEREVPLPSGGSLVIDETEAMIAIDVNSGKMRHHRDAETTAYQTNLEAVDEICRQIRLRDVGGLVLCDLIDMIHRSHRRTIEQRFRERLKHDRAASKTLPISQFGIVEMTRQRQKQSVRSTHYATCPHCEGRGVLKRPASVADEAMRELASVIEHERVAKVELAVAPRVAGALLSHKRKTLGRLEAQLGKPVEVRVSEDIPVDRVNIYAYDESGADVDIARLPAARPPTNLPEWKGQASASSHWASDSLQEEPDLPEPSDAEPADDPVVSALDAALDPAEPGEASTPAKRRRRRRGGRGRRTAREAEAISTEEPATTASEPDDAAPPSVPEDQATKPSKSARRRRRRSSAAKHDEQPASAAPAEGGSPDPVDASDRPLRGDSWDLPPEAVKPARTKKVKEPAPEASHNGQANDDVSETDATPQPKPRKRQSARARARAAAAETSEEQQPSTDEVDSPPPPAPASKSRSARTSKKVSKKPSKKRTRKTAKSAPKSSADPAPPPLPTPSVVTEPVAIRPKRALYGSRRRLKPGKAVQTKDAPDD